MSHMDLDLDSDLDSDLDLNLNMDLDLDLDSDVRAVIARVQKRQAEAKFAIRQATIDVLYDHDDDENQGLNATTTTTTTTTLQKTTTLPPFVSLQLPTVTTDTVTERLTEPIMQILLEAADVSLLASMSCVCKKWRMMANQQWIWERLYHLRFDEEEKASTIAIYMKAAAQASGIIINETERNNQKTISHRSPAFNFKKAFRERCSLDRIVCDIKPASSETSMQLLEILVRQTEMMRKGDLIWRRSQLVPLAYGLEILRIEADISKAIAFEDVETVISQHDDIVGSVELLSLRRTDISKLR